MSVIRQTRLATSSFLSEKVCLQATPSQMSPKKERTKQIHKLMDELQSRKRLGWVRNKGGQVLADPIAIAQALEQQWAEVTTPS